MTSNDITSAIYNAAYNSFIINHGHVTESTLLLAHLFAAHIASGKSPVETECDACGRMAFTVTPLRDLVLVLHAQCNGAKGGDPIA